ncbi:glycoside hydrolase family 18 protein [Collybiopsis luxurians FD-317 M1]|uniref:Glycoside hydrolase family 18 protein n=1 Tax=Collybiopsis luxurians FD-317 M1 TaxID=944289 RepID=A0A0D0ARD7_9AGAR|nr:glycoside hydrolase family 18 protein [Collybiopsis luxurians FD-317 M1]
MHPTDGPSPVHRLVVYYQTQCEGKDDKTSKYISPTPLIGLASHLIVGAFHLDGNIARMQGSGVKVLGMLGGAAQGSYRNLYDHFDDWYGRLSECIKEYKLDGIDLDIEETVVEEDKKTKEQKNKLFDLLKKFIPKLKADFGADFIITFAPVAYALKGGTDPFSQVKYSEIESNSFYSDFGVMSATNDYIEIVENNGWNPSRIVAGTITNSDHGGPFKPLDQVRTTVRKLLQKYGHRFGGLAAWEYSKSEPDPEEPWNWAATMKVTMDNWKEVLVKEIIVSSDDK